MNDTLRISKDKRHRSSSSLAAAALDTTRSERRLDPRDAITEMEQPFRLAEARCRDFEEKIELMRALKRKKKMKRRSMTKVSESSFVVEPTPLISIRTQQKTRRPAEYQPRRPSEAIRHATRSPSPAERPRRQMSPILQGQRMEHDNSAARARTVRRRARRERGPGPGSDDERRRRDGRRLVRPLQWRPAQERENDRRGEPAARPESPVVEIYNNSRGAASHSPHSPHAPHSAHAPHSPHSPGRTRKDYQGSETACGRAPRPPVSPLRPRDAGTARLQPPAPQDPEPPQAPQPPARLETVASDTNCKSIQSRRRRCRARRYELPTVASEMKRAPARAAPAALANIPFVGSKSTAPSHNIGANIQQVLNGLKIQQPLSGIPLTMAHHMGLRHIPFYSNEASMEPSLNHRDINLIKLGERALSLPTHKYMSFSRLLAWYRQGDGIVPKFLRALNSAPPPAVDDKYSAECVGSATSKEYDGTARAALAEYAALYREYAALGAAAGAGAGAGAEAGAGGRRDELARELLAREAHIRQVVQQYSDESISPAQSRVKPSGSGAAVRRVSRFSLVDAGQ